MVTFDDFQKEHWKEYLIPIHQLHRDKVGQVNKQTLKWIAIQLNTAASQLRKMQNKIWTLQRSYKNKKISHLSKTNKIRNMVRKIHPLKHNAPTAQNNIWDEEV